MPLNSTSHAAAPSCHPNHAARAAHLQQAAASRGHHVHHLAGGLAVARQAQQLGAEGLRQLGLEVGGGGAWKRWEDQKWQDEG